MATTAPRVARVLVVAALAVTMAASSVAAGADAARPSEKRGNATGAAAGSPANGTGNLKMGLASTPDRRIRVTWKRPAPASQIRKWTVTVGPSRSLNIKARTFQAGRRAQSLVVPQAFGATPASGNYSFVQVTIFRKNGVRASSPTKWIQAPVTAFCTASAANQVTVGTFNVRGWDKEPASSRFSWHTRGPNAAAQIVSSGAHVVAIQEANGQADAGFGPVRQHQWLLDAMNAADPDPAHAWADALGDEPYRRGGGLVGTRIFVDTTKLTVLESGIQRLSGKDGKGDSLLPWARLRAVGGTQPAFYFASTHLRVGENASAFQAREEQVKAMIPFLTALQARAGEQVILGGDMNSSINSTPFNRVQVALLDAGFYDSFATPVLVNPQFGSTFAFKFPLRVTPHRRDYLMSLGPVKGSCGYTNMVPVNGSQVASDHFMQIASFPLSTV
jgi:endonuclease/exonuclease/phosphatase family metal-dependent hydrolase